MKITFFCDSCRSELTVASHFAGRAILCPRCRQKTQIPTSSVSSRPASAASSSNVAQAPSGSDVRESSPHPVKFCGDFVPNPFALSVRLETFVPFDGDDAFEPTIDAPASKTPSVNELISTLLEEENR